MHKKKHKSAIVFLGGGRITSAICAGLRRARYRGSIIVYDRNPEKLHALRKESRVEIAPDLTFAIRNAAMLVIAVRPMSVKNMLREVASCGVSTRRLCVSLAAGISVAHLRRGLPEARWVRAMPSPVCRIARGLTALSFDRGTGRRDRARVRELFAKVGPVIELAEGQMDALTAAFSPTHGYHALGHLARAAEREGLDHRSALMAAAHALGDGITYWRESGNDLEQLLLEAATPGGTASATITAMDKAGYARSVTKGLAAGIQQARRNRRK